MSNTDTDTRTVTILGPLGGDDMFHVHAAGCADVARRPIYRGVRDSEWTAEVATWRQLVEEIYSDFIFANDEQPWDSFGDEVRTFPCVGELP